MRYILINEEMMNDQTYLGTNQYLIDLDKVPGFEVTDALEYRYIKHIINAIKTNTSIWSTTKKFSFSDAPEWYDQLKPDAIVVPDTTITYEVQS
jgi:hypothetical protein